MAKDEEGESEGKAQRLESGDWRQRDVSGSRVEWCGSRSFCGGGASF
jgi:hypothetical protein